MSTPPPETRLASQPGAASSSRRNFLRGVGGVVAAGAIGTAAYGSITSASGGDDLRASLTLIAPASAGGGWDTFGREMQAIHRANGIVNNTQVVNIPGAGGTIALANLTNLHGRSNTLCIGGTGQLAATIQYGTAVTYNDITPIATCVEESDVIVVAGDSPFTTLDELFDAWASDPGAVPWTGGGSFDQLVVTQCAIAAGLSPVDMTYISSDGGGEASQAIMNKTVQAAASGYPDAVDLIDSGRYKALAWVGESAPEGVDLPSTVELGYDVTLTNWRSIAAPLGIPQEDVTTLTDIIKETVATTEWEEAVQRYHWSRNELYGEELASFFEEQAVIIANLYEELGV